LPHSSVAILLIDYFMPWNTYSGFKNKIDLPGLHCFADVGVFFAIAYLLKSPEGHSLINVLKKRLTRPKY
jgi:hypothetical protein